MKKLIVGLMALLMLSGCAISIKFVEVDLEDEAVFYVDGDIKGELIRDHTSEGQEPKADLDVSASLTDGVFK